MIENKLRSMCFLAFKNKIYGNTPRSSNRADTENKYAVKTRL